MKKFILLIALCALSYSAPGHAGKKFTSASSRANARFQKAKNKEAKRIEALAAAEVTAEEKVAQLDEKCDAASALVAHLNTQVVEAEEKGLEALARSNGGREKEIEYYGREM